MMLRPRWPSAGPIGGDGLAAPAGTCSLRNPATFFATVLALLLSDLAPAGTDSRGSLIPWLVVRILTGQEPRLTSHVLRLRHAYRVWRSPGPSVGQGGWGMGACGWTRSEERRVGEESRSRW